MAYGYRKKEYLNNKLAQINWSNTASEMYSQNIAPIFTGQIEYPPLSGHVDWSNLFQIVDYDKLQQSPVEYLRCKILCSTNQQPIEMISDQSLPNNLLCGFIFANELN